MQFVLIHKLSHLQFKKKSGHYRHLSLARDAERQNAVAFGIPIAGIGIVHVRRGALASIVSIIIGCVKGLVSAFIFALRASTTGTEEGREPLTAASTEAGNVQAADGL